MDKIKVGILGYGNLGKGIEQNIKCNEDMELVAIFTRRDPKTLKTLFNTPVFNISEMDDFVGKIDVMILCGGSATDLPVQGPEVLKKFNTVDSFDTHAKIPEYLEKMNRIANEAKTVGAISIGWDPGLFSIMRSMFSSFLPNGETYTFWGKGVSQGHSDAIRRIDGVKNAVQYTVPIDSAISKVREMSNPQLSTRDKHKRVCYVVAEDGYDKEKIKSEIINMPNYFADYDTEVNFISEEELKQNHSKMPHGGFVLRSGETYSKDKMLLELSIKLDSNPQFTTSILLAYARAVCKLAKEKEYGAKTVLDIPLKYLTKLSFEEMVKDI